jgi:Fe2+ or Zn2+ uptake regulation protein
MRALFEFVLWIFWAIGSGLWTIYHTLHSRSLGSLIIDDETDHFICRRCGKHFTFEVPWETRQ